MMQNKNLSVLAYANGFTLWHYITTDKLDEVLSQDYFNEAETLIHNGDMIIINIEDVGVYIRSVRHIGDGIVWNNVQ